MDVGVLETVRGVSGQSYSNYGGDQHCKHYRVRLPGIVDIFEKTPVKG